MKVIISYVLLAIALVGCSSEGSLPNPTGKGSIRVINAMPTAPTVNALIEERALGQIDYKESTERADYDDFEYVFNFEVFLAGQVTATRVESVRLKVERDTEYNMIVSGDVNNPTITIETKAERDFADSATDVEVQFAHLAEGFPDVDIYFAGAGVTPALGQQAATLTLGAFSDPIDFPTGDYVLSVTPAGDPSTIVFQSTENNFVGGQTLLIGAFAPDGNDVDPLAIRAFRESGPAARLQDFRALPTFRFIHGASDVGPVDVYLDEALTTPVVQNVPYQGITDDFEVAEGAGTLYLTPAGDTSTILFENTLNAISGTRAHIAVVGNSGTYGLTAYIPDRRSISTVATLQVVNTSLNFSPISTYVTERGTPIQEGDLPRNANTATAGVSALANLLDEGSFDIYITLFGSTDIVAGPFEIDVQYGDRIDLVLFDTVDPTVGEIVEIPAP